jgi:hypothetical protein
LVVEDDVLVAMDLEAILWEDSDSAGFILAMIGTGSALLLSGRPGAGSWT